MADHSERRAARGDAGERAPGLRRAILWSAALLPPLAAAAAFARSAHETAWTALLGEGSCGALSMATRGAWLFGHCVDCYVAAAQAGTFMVAAVLAVDLASGVRALTPRVNNAQR